MSLLHAQFTDWSVRFLKLPGGNFGMYSIFILLFCLFFSVIGLAVVLIYRRHYNSILRISILFEIIYFLFLIISGENPFRYFSVSNSENTLTVLMYLNGIAVFIIMFLIHLLHKYLKKNVLKK